MKVYSQAGQEYLGDFDFHKQDVVEIAVMSCVGDPDQKYRRFRLREKNNTWVLIEGDPEHVKKYLQQYAKRNSR